MGYKFGLVLELDSTKSLIAFIGVVLFLIVFDFLTELMEFYLEGTKLYHRMIEMIYKELMLIGLVSFAIIMIDAVQSSLSAADPLLAEWLISIDYSHILLFFLTLFFVIHAFYLMRQAIVCSREYRKLGNMSVGALIDELKQLESSYWSRFLFQFEYLPLSSTRDHVEFFLLKSLFRDTYWMPDNFYFQDYLSHCFNRFSLKAANRSWVTWAVLIVFAVLNYVRLKIHANFGSCHIGSAAHDSGHYNSTSHGNDSAVVSHIGSILLADAYGLSTPRYLSEGASLEVPEECRTNALKLFLFFAALLVAFTIIMVFFSRLYKLRMLHRIGLDSPEQYLEFLKFCAADEEQQSQRLHTREQNRNVGLPVREESPRLTNEELKEDIERVLDADEHGHSESEIREIAHSIEKGLNFFRDRIESTILFVRTLFYRCFPANEQSEMVASSESEQLSSEVDESAGENKPLNYLRRASTMIDQSSPKTDQDNSFHARQQEKKQILGKLASKQPAKKFNVALNKWEETSDQDSSASNASSSNERVHVVCNDKPTLSPRATGSRSPTSKSKRDFSAAQRVMQICSQGDSDPNLRFNNTSVRRGPLERQSSGQKLNSVRRDSISFRKPRGKSSFFSQSAPEAEGYSTTFAGAQANSGYQSHAAAHDAQHLAHLSDELEHRVRPDSPRAEHLADVLQCLSEMPPERGPHPHTTVLVSAQHQPAAQTHHNNIHNTVSVCAPQNEHTLVEMFLKKQSLEYHKAIEAQNQHRSASAPQSPVKRIAGGISGRISAVLGNDAGARSVRKRPSFMVNAHHHHSGHADPLSKLQLSPSRPQSAPQSAPPRDVERGLPEEKVTPSSDEEDWRLDADFSGIYLFGEPLHFFRAVELCLLFNCLYLAFWTTDFIYIVTKGHEHTTWKGLDQFAMVIPVLLVLPCIGYIAETCSMLIAISELDLEVIYEVLCEFEETNKLVKDLREKIISRVEILESAEEDKFEVIRELFQEIDQDQSGKIDRIEFRFLLRTLRLTYSDDRFSRLFRAVDTSGEGRIDWSELFRLLFPNEVVPQLYPSLSQKTDSQKSSNQMKTALSKPSLKLKGNNAVHPTNEVITSAGTEVITSPVRERRDSKVRSPSINEEIGHSGYCELSACHAILEAEEEAGSQRADLMTAPPVPRLAQNIQSLLDSVAEDQQHNDKV